MNKIRVGVYGNNGGHQVTKEFKNHPEINAFLVASCQCENAEGIEGVKIYDTLDDMINDDSIDLISLCSPDRSKQADEAIKCMKNGKHVYAEKPCAMTEEKLDELIKTSKETGMMFHEMAGTIFTQPYFAMHELVKTGCLGDIVQVFTQKSYPLRIDARPQNEDIDGGMIRQVGVHNLRFIEHITGIKIKEIKAIQTKLGNPVENGNLHTAASYIMTLENGGIASATANYLNFAKGMGKYGNECVRIYGTKGYAEIMDAGRDSRVIIGDECLGSLVTDKKVKPFFLRYIDTLLGIDKMPLSLEDELHPTRMVIRAANEGLLEL